MTNNLTPRPEVRGAIVGVDPHKHIHVAVAIDSCGIHLGDQSFAADSGGYQALLTWAETHGRIQAFGIEGTGGYGVGLARAVRRAGHRVVEVNRADRRLRRVAGKSDRIDAEAAARSVLAGQATATPKTADGAVEMIRQLKVARDTAVKARTAAMNTLKQISVNAPSVVREPLHGLTAPRLLARCAALRPGRLDTPTASAKYTLRALARRWFALAEEIATHDRHLARLTTETSPTLRAGVRGGRQQRGRVLDCLRRQPRADSLGGRRREALWRVSHPRLVREDHWAAPPLPGRSPPGQRRPLSVGHRPHAVPPANGRLRCATYGRRPHQT